MIFFLILTAVWAVMMIFPFTVGFASKRNSTDERPLNIKDNNVRDPRYFSKSFVEMMDNALKNKKGDTIKLSKEEKIIDEDIIKGEKEINCLVVAEKKLFTVEGCRFYKEILARQYAGIGKRNHLRAIASQGALTLKEECVIDRWVDAEGALRIHKNCDLGISATSNDRIVIDEGCVFRRIYAPQIIVGKDSKVRCIDRCRIYTQELVSEDVLWNVNKVDDNDKLTNTIINSGNIRIGKGAVVYGSIKSNKNIRVLRGAVITGNVIADGDITLEDDVTVRGTLFSQESIYIGKNNIIGECGMVKSIVARERVMICDGSVIYGYISGEKKCGIVNGEQYNEEIHNTY